MTKAYEKLLRKIPAKDRERIQHALECVHKRDFSAMQRQKLKGYDCIFRIRIGSERIIYYDDGSIIILKAIQRRNESTYSDF